MKLNSINILVGGVGHPTKKSLINSFKLNNERNVRVIGTDCDSTLPKPEFVDDFVIVPRDNEPKYINKILDICEKKKVDVFYAATENDNILVNQYGCEFEKIGTRLIKVGGLKEAKLVQNKCAWNGFLKEKGVRTPDFEIFKEINQIKHLKKIVYGLGYPESEVVMKPCKGVGGRGVIIISNKKKNSVKDSRHSNQVIDLDQLKKLLQKNYKEGESYLFIKFFSGKFYSVDVLSDNKEPVYIIPKLKYQGNASFTRMAKVDLNLKVINYVREVSKVLRLDYLQNYELAMDENEKPYIFDINPRGGASVDCCRAAGANIAYFALKKAIGEEIPKVEVTDGIGFIRYMYEEYTRF